MEDSCSVSLFSRSWRTRAWPAVLGLVIGTAAGAGGSKGQVPATQPAARAAPMAPIVLAAVDGMEWDVILPLLREGKLPVLARLMRQGSFGLLDSMLPTQSPVIWTSIATGKPPDQHGILGFLRPPDPDGGSARLYNNLDRRAKAIWNILAEHGRRPAVIGWWMTYPVEQFDGVMVAQTNTIDQLDTAEGRAVWKGRLVPGKPYQVHPPEWQEEVMAILARNDRGIERLAERTFGRAGSPRPLLAQRLWDNTLWALRADATYLEIARRLAASAERLDLLAFYLGGPDVVGHRFWRYLQPELFEHRPTTQEIEDLGHLIPDYYQYVDRSIGEILAALASEATVLIVSDHGMHPANREQRFEADRPPADVKSGDHEDAPPGVLIAAGPGIAVSSLSRSLSVLRREDLPRLGSVHDVLPTLLALVGLPLAQDLPGRVLPRLLGAAPPERPRITTYETPAWREARARQASAFNPGDDQERIEQLRSLGYIQQ